MAKSKKTKKVNARKKVTHIRKKVKHTRHVEKQKAPVEVKKVVTPITVEVVPEPPQQKAILFELDTILFSGRQIMFEVLKDVLKEKGMHFNIGMYSRHCLYAPVKTFVASLIDPKIKKRPNEAKLAEQISGKLKDRYIEQSQKINAGIQKLLQAAKDKNILIGALSSFNAETTQQIMEKYGLRNFGITSLSFYEEAKEMPSADAWLKLAKKLSVSGRLCYVLGSSNRACKAALSAGMRCTAITDAYTSFQDFGGADYIFDTFDGKAVQDVIAIVESR